MMNISKNGWESVLPKFVWIAIAVSTMHGSAIGADLPDSTIIAEICDDECLFSTSDDDLDWGEDSIVEDFFTPGEIEYSNFEKNNNCQEISRQKLLIRPSDYAGKCVTFDTFLVLESYHNYTSYDPDNNAGSVFNIQVDDEQNLLVLPCVSDDKELTISGFVSVQQGVPSVVAKKTGCSPFS